MHLNSLEPLKHGWMDLGCWWSCCFLKSQTTYRFQHGAEISLKIDKTSNPQSQVLAARLPTTGFGFVGKWQICRRYWTLWRGYGWGVTSCKTVPVFWSDPRTIEVSLWKWNMESQNTHSGITSATTWVHFPHLPNYYQVPAKCLLLLPLLLFSTVDSPCYSFGPKWAEAAETAGERSHSCKPVLYKKLHTGAGDDQNFFQTTLNPILGDDAGGAWGCCSEQNMEPPRFSEGRKRGRLPSSRSS